MNQEIVKKKSLAAYVFELEQICSEIDEETGVISDDLVLRFNGASLALADKVDGWIGFLDALKVSLAEAKERKERADNARRAFEAMNKRLRDYLKFVMETHPNTPFKGSEGSLALQRNPESVEIDFTTVDKTIYKAIDSSLLTLEPSLNNYVKAITAYVIDTERLKADLKAGVELSWARLTRGHHVRIR